MLATVSFLLFPWWIHNCFGTCLFCTHLRTYYKLVNDAQRTEMINTDHHGKMAILDWVREWGHLRGTFDLFDFRFWGCFLKYIICPFWSRGRFVGSLLPENFYHPIGSPQPLRLALFCVTVSTIPFMTGFFFVDQILLSFHFKPEACTTGRWRSTRGFRVMCGDCGQFQSQPWEVQHGLPKGPDN